MWKIKESWSENNQVQKIELESEGTALKYGEVIQLWQTNESFRLFFTKILVDSPFEGFRWETPCVTTLTLEKKFEFVLLQANALQRPVDRQAFSQHFDSTQPIVKFPNLGKNAVLVVPCPIATDNVYGHLASFLRGAPEKQIHQLWISVAEAMNIRVSDNPVWLSTAGMGVSWLHVRLDNRPKYYGHRPYREIC